MRIIHNKNATFYWSGEVMNHPDGVLANLSDYQINSQLRTKNGELLVNLPVFKNDPQSGYIRIQADSRSWQVGDYLWDILLKKGNITVATQTVNVRVVDGGTHVND